MTNNVVPHLCGGILFDLLLEAKKPRRKARNKLDGGSDGLSNTALFNALVYVVTGEDNYSIGGSGAKAVSNYKKCCSSKGIYIPFTNHVTQNVFDAKFKSKDNDLFKRMSEFIETYLNKDRCEWLTRAIIETMQEESLDFDVLVNYSKTMKVHDLHNANIILFVPFLLSILHYVVINCPDCESGRATFESWYEQAGSKNEWKFISNIGNNIKNIIISFDPYTSLDPLPSENSVSTVELLEPEHAKVFTTDNRDNNQNESSDKEEGSQNNTTQVSHQTIVYQYGHNPVHIDYVENLKL